MVLSVVSTELDEDNDDGNSVDGCEVDDETYDASVEDLGLDNNSVEEIEFDEDSVEEIEVEDDSEVDDRAGRSVLLSDGDSGFKEVAWLPSLGLAESGIGLSDKEIVGLDTDISVVVTMDNVAGVEEDDCCTEDSDEEEAVADDGSPD